jgi:hypothetical protein
MPIHVVCPICKAEFNVSDKFAGRQGPCPKCKSPIKIPGTPVPAAPVASAGTVSAGGATATAGAPAAAKPPAGPPPEVKIHAPEGTGPGPGGKPGPGGRPTLKPIMRKDSKIGRVPLIASIIGVAGALAAAWFGTSFWQAGDPPLLRALALLFVSIPTTAAGYSILRDDELEPFRGRSLWLRSFICGLIYAGLWCGYWFIPPDMTKTVFNWFFMAPPILVVGAATAFATYDLDFGSGFFHYCFYLAVTLGLGFLAGLAMPWSGVAMM